MSEQDSLSRRERRRAAAGGGDPTDPTDIKDRNQRLRADVEGKRKDRSKERHQRVADGLAASEVVDDALARSADATGKFVRSNFAWMQWIVIGGIAAAVGILIYDYRVKKGHEKSGDALGLALVTEAGRVASAETEKPTDPNLVDTRPEFSTAEARGVAATKEFETLSKSSDAKLALLGKMGKAGVLYDAEKYDEAEKLYRSTADEARETPDIQARALEGVFLCRESRKDFDQALKALDELAKSELIEMKRIARYHRARILFFKSDRDGAKKLLVELRDELKKTSKKVENPIEMLSGPKTYLARQVEDLLKLVDPGAVEKNDIAAQLEALKKSMGSLSMGSSRGASAPQAPAAPAQAPTAPAQAPAPTPESNPWGPAEGNQ